MVCWLYCSPISVDRSLGGVDFTCSNDFYPPLQCLEEEGGRESAPCVFCSSYPDILCVRSLSLRRKNRGSKLKEIFFLSNHSETFCFTGGAVAELLRVEQRHLLHDGGGRQLPHGRRQLFRGYDLTLPETESSLPTVVWTAQGKIAFFYFRSRLFCELYNKMLAQRLDCFVL